MKGKIDKKKYDARIDELSSVIWRLMIASSPIILWSKAQIEFNSYFHELSNSAHVSDSVREHCYSKYPDKPLVTAYLTPTVFYSSDGQVASKAIVLI